ncbi:hypothetical protein PHYSODRAFT_473963 [Phytophthora sojae]|uniref:Uncharacterized protein n=1 Tax=Phytophthora sojae (strain P6497) TaxID=1094619 RepID=G4YJT5_PHYSP|nr:hypothetical protein PHYSODRAFT_473963 [Phytophthora sojae]EGZ26642.1 hypothetical protein PHYSODRAFT_473963 [Phytophthora sojae]|eukprot:XP_009513917.1 hypothetical protein PHYSODRAFT_473963 [Phytophthora sojae]
MAPPPPLEVASASFFQLECSHAQLFQPEYKRSNRTKGLKILRCFPHCCPEHIDRSYCGTSLSVRVQFGAESTSESPSVDLFARFEAVSDVATQTEANPEGQWMKGILDQPSKLVTAIRAADSTSDEKPMIFHLNSRSYARWYYDWESGANKAQRLMKHVLKAYIVERCAVDKDDRIVAASSRDAVKQLYRVAHVVTSPEFTLEDVPDLLEDKLRWEHMNLPAVSVSRNLALVYSFLRWAPLSVYASFVDELTLLRVLADATLWFFSSDTRQWMRSFFRQHASFVMDKHGMRECFVMFLQELQTRLDAQVFSQTSLQSLANAAEEVIAAVYSYEYFHARRPRVRKILSGQSFAGWNAFVAQLRETYIGMTSFPGVSRQLMKSQAGLDFEQAHPPQNSVECDWNAEWLLDVDEAVWKPSENAIKARTLHVRSTQGFAGAQDCMRLVLDGRDRVFSQFPNAMATEANTGAWGDYIGEVQVEKSGRLIVYLQMFSWSMRGNGPSYHSRMRIECWHSQRLCISGDVLATTALASFSSEQALYLPEMSLRSKREAVEHAFAQQIRDDPRARSAGGPWKELSRFRLSYITA